MSALTRDEQLGQGLAYQGDVPLRWYVPERRLDDARTLQLQNQNEEVLRTFLELGDAHTEVNEEQRDNYPDLVRLESKIDLVLKLLSQVYARDIHLPDVCSLTLGSAYAEWTDARAPSVNQHIHLEIFLDTNYPRPLLFPASVRKVTKQKDRFKVMAELEFPGELVHFSLEKFIFRHHRRSVALSRR